jgi:hypothetical protein
MVTVDSPGAHAGGCGGPGFGAGLGGGRFTTGLYTAGSPDGLTAGGIGLAAGLPGAAGLLGAAAG